MTLAFPVVNTTIAIVTVTFLILSMTIAVLSSTIAALTSAIAVLGLSDRETFQSDRAFFAFNYLLATSSHPAIASCKFAMTSSIVSPSVMQPGNAGTSAQ